MNNSDGLVRWQIKYNNRGLYFCNHLCLKAAERNEVPFGGCHMKKRAQTGHKEKKTGIGNAIVFSMILVFAVFESASAATKTWNTTTGDWFVDGNWSGGLPVAGDDIVIANAGAYVSLTNSTPWMSSMVISNATMSFSNWDTTLSVTNLMIRNGGIQTCVGSFTNNAMSNRVVVVCSNMTIDVGGQINVDYVGYMGGVARLKGNGPGGGPGDGYGGSGAGHGGYGGDAGHGQGVVYGQSTAPEYAGSGGGGGYKNPGGPGGGAVRIQASGQVMVNGQITANGHEGYNVGSEYGWQADIGGGGSGGSVFITCNTLVGIHGVIQATGGRGYQNSPYYYSGVSGGDGGGGRIAVIYDTAAQSNQALPNIQISTLPGLGGNCPGDIGTLYFPDSSLFSSTNPFSGQWLVPGFTNWSVADLQVSNAWIRLPDAGFQLTVTNTLTVMSTYSATVAYKLCKLELTNGPTVNCGQSRISGGALTLSGATSGPTLNCAGDLTLTNASRLYVSAGLTNAGVAPGYGAMVNIGGDIRVAGNSWIYPAAHPTNGAVVLFSMRNLTLDLGGGINADYLGYIGSRSLSIQYYHSYQGEYGPGSSAAGFNYGLGSGYGGSGGYCRTGLAGGPAYGSSNAPVAPGSGCLRMNGSMYRTTGADGGGSVQIRATDTVAIEGTITSNGGAGNVYYGGGASGGGIYITCRTFVGSSNGELWAKGGAGCNHVDFSGGGGGGGRIAVWRIYDNSPTVISSYVNGGAPGPDGITTAGTDGTVVWGWLPPPETLILIR